MQPALSVFEVQVHLTPTGDGSHANLNLSTQGSLSEIRYVLGPVR